MGHQSSAGQWAYWWGRRLVELFCAVVHGKLIIIQNKKIQHEKTTKYVPIVSVSMKYVKDKMLQAG